MHDSRTSWWLHRVLVWIKHKSLNKKLCKKTIPSQMFQLYNVVVKLMDTQRQPLFTEHHFYVAFPLKCILFKSRSLSSDVTAKWSVCNPPRFMNHDHGQAKNNPSSAGLLLKHVYPEQTWIWLHFVSKWQHDDSGFVFCTKSTQKQFCHFFAPVDKLLLPWLITFSSLQYYLDVICLLFHIYQKL